MTTTLNIPLTVEDRVLAALRDEAKAADVPFPTLLGQILERRYARPDWSEIAELTALGAELEQVTAERDRARTTAVLHVEHHELVMAGLRAALDTGELVASLSVRRRFFDEAAIPGYAPSEEATDA